MIIKCVISTSNKIHHVTGTSRRAQDEHAKLVAGGIILHGTSRKSLSLSHVPAGSMAKLHFTLSRLRVKSKTFPPNSKLLEDYQFM